MLNAQVVKTRQIEKFTIILCASQVNTTAQFFESFRHASEPLSNGRSTKKCFSPHTLSSTHSIKYPCIIDNNTLNQNNHSKCPLPLQSLLPPSKLEVFSSDPSFMKLVSTLEMITKLPKLRACR
mmetsp:Transcript_15706/g.31656  ORF Transcript_15706/g.31656 Transcript_15706/m.31656 type:complete len:124 (-) Transcript_15706:2696-3067(-)